MNLPLQLMTGGLMIGLTVINGFLLFGWTTAFIFEIISLIYKREAKSL